MRRLSAAGAGAIGFIYYSGHGAAEKDTNINYLIPVDATEPRMATFWDDSLKLDDVLKLLDGAPSAAKFVVFDACRNELQLPSKDTSKGLVPVAEQNGMFIAYASAPGRTASDKGEKSGPYAAALSAELAKPGLDHLNLFQNVKEAVLAATGGAQQPWESNGLRQRVYLTGEPTTPADMALWNSVSKSDDVSALQRYLERFPNGLYANTAAGALFLDRRKPTYVGGILEMANARLYPFWGALTEALRTGNPQNEAKEGRDLFDEIYRSPAILAEFLKAMSGISLGAANASP